MPSWVLFVFCCLFIVGEVGDKVKARHLYIVNALVYVKALVQKGSVYDKVNARRMCCQELV